MYSSIRIQGYRGLESFRMQGLGRVNLLVGTNNCGKTSILECIELLRSAGDPSVLSSIVGRRGEWGDRNALLRERGAIPAAGEILDVSHLFTNHALGCPIRIEAERSGDVDPVVWNNKVTVRIERQSGSVRGERDTEEPEEGDDSESLVLHVEWLKDRCRGPVTDNGLLPASLLRCTSPLERAYRRRLLPNLGSGTLGSVYGDLAHRRGRWPNSPDQAVHFVRAAGVTTSDVVQMVSRFVLTPKDEDITAALRIVEPGIERMAPVAGPTRDHAPGGVVLKLRDVADRVPIGSMGDGLWRMLGLALSVANAEGGVLLVDEIDTGLHYSVMEDMWRMIGKQAAALSVQVFATTHSRDCYESLAAIAASDPGDVTIQRIDRSRGEAVRFSREAIVAAAERSIEVR